MLLESAMIELSSLTASVTLRLSASCLMPPKNYPYVHQLVGLLLLFEDGRSRVALIFALGTGSIAGKEVSRCSPRIAHSR